MRSSERTFRLKGTKAERKHVLVGWEEDIRPSFDTEETDDQDALRNTNSSDPKFKDMTDQYHKKKKKWSAKH